MAVRTICIPVAEVLEGGTKKEFYDCLRAVLKQTVQVANLTLSHCLKQDDLSSKKAPKIYVYPSLAGFCVGFKGVLAAITNEVSSKYIKDFRYKVIRGIASAPSFRSMPLPLLKSMRFDVDTSGEFPVAQFKVGEKLFRVRLAGGSNYRDQLRGIKNAKKICDSKIWIDKKGKAIVGVCIELPPPKQRSLSGEMLVTSMRDHLIQAIAPRSTTPFVINADEAKRWESESNAAFQRLRQDRKSGANRRKIRDSMRLLSQKNDARKKLLCHEVSARVVNRAAQCSVATIVVDFTIKSYIQSFPWFQLAAMIKYKAEDCGIEVVEKTMSAVDVDVCCPHVYFKYSPATHRVKIGQTGRVDGGRHGSETDSAEELLVLAIDNQPKSKLIQREKKYHAMFNDHRVKLSGRKEWFHAEPVLEWLRAVGWLGNAGNISQISQVLDEMLFSSSEGHLQPYRECAEGKKHSECSHNAVSGEDIAGNPATALAVTS